MIEELDRIQIDGRQQENSAFIEFYQAIKARRGHQK
jgi:hypothetical protein